jgi:hypothetical protein
MDTLPSNRYTVRSFFGAIHVTLSRAMPLNRSLGEYIVLVILLGRLLSRLFHYLKSRPQGYDTRFSTSIGLLVCQAELKALEGYTLTQAIVGFSLCGNSQQKKKFIRARTLNLPALANLPISYNQGQHWVAGNCAEPETFAHLPLVQQTLQDLTMDPIGMGGVEVEAVEIMSMSLTLKLLERESNPIKGKQFCVLCQNLAQNMSSSLSSQILDLCPV